MDDVLMCVMLAWRCNSGSWPWCSGCGLVFHVATYGYWSGWTVDRVLLIRM